MSNIYNIILEAFIKLFRHCKKAFSQKEYISRYNKMMKKKYEKAFLLVETIYDDARIKRFIAYLKHLPDWKLQNVIQV